MIREFSVHEQIKRFKSILRVQRQTEVYVKVVRLEVDSTSEMESEDSKRSDR
jgi:hypothetical protein